MAMLQVSGDPPKLVTFRDNAAQKFGMQNEYITPYLVTVGLALCQTVPGTNVSLFRPP